MRIRLRHIKEDPQWVGRSVTIKGWVRTVREQKSFAFIELNDGSSLSNLQVITQQIPQGLTTGAAIVVQGVVVVSPGKKQSVEIQADKIEVVGCSPEDFPLQKKRHSLEFLRTIPHLRARSQTLGAVMRVRDQLAYATHDFFHRAEFLYIHTPILTTSDCEGAGEMFRVTTDSQSEEHFFGRPAYLTVSGQLQGEMYAQAFRDIYTFGPTFRAENSNTPRHLAEFWMIEPEMAFADLHDDIALAEQYVRFVLASVLQHNMEDLLFLQEQESAGLVEQLQGVVNSPFVRLSYTEAVEILQRSSRSFVFPVTWGLDLQSEHERYLCEEYCKQPVVVTDYPMEIKSFYMRRNSDERTVANMDLLVAGVGELIGGSQREERLDVLERVMMERGMNPSDYQEYLDLRRYGSTPHAGFGLGFERLVRFATGMDNIRDVIPFPRYPGHAEG